MATKAQLIDFVLGYFRARGTGQAGSAEDIAEVEKYLPSGIDDVNQRLGVYIADSESASDAQAPWLAVSIAQLPPLASHFGVAPDPTMKAYAENMLGAQVSADAGGTVKFTSF